MNIPRIVLAGTHSGVGKTTLATGLMAVLKLRRRLVQGYKVGPDYIDPSYHTAVTGRPSRNLDRWLLGENISGLFYKSAQNSWAVIEGVMGLYDGMKGRRGFGSTADIAKKLKAPIVLIVDAASMSDSVAALVHGFKTFDSEINLAGVILNRVKSLGHGNILKEALAQIDCPVLGSVPFEGMIKLPERHLGLIPVGEEGINKDYFNALAKLVEKYIDIDSIEDIMQQAPILEYKELCNPSSSLYSSEVERKVRLGVAYDEAFLFYYEDSLQTLKDLGFELAFFSPLHDKELPADLDAVMIGGGFPELHLSGLSSNFSMLESLRKFKDTGKPIYAECGGYMYLGKSIKDFSGEIYPMVGLIPMQAEMTSRLQGIGYREGFLKNDTFLGSEGSSVRGHEFHYSKVHFDNDNTSPAYRIERNGEFYGYDGFLSRNIVASYLHINFAGYPNLVSNWVNFIRRGSPC